MSINWRTEKESVVYIFNRILFSTKNEWTTDGCYNMNEPQKRNAMCKVLNVKDD